MYKNIIYKESNRKRKYSQNKFFRIKYKNLGGSSESIDTNLLLPNDPAIEYKNSRSKVKEYISLFKEHVEKEDHPINIISRKFSKVFSREVKNTIDHLITY